MSAGYIQLAAIGQQDAFLTGSPSITYFSGVYRRHTPFVLEAYEIPFLEPQMLYGTTNTCRIPAKGDLVKGLTLKLDLPGLENTGSNWSWPEQASTPTALKIAIVSGGIRTIYYIPANVLYWSTLNMRMWLHRSPFPLVEYSAPVAFRTITPYIRTLVPPFIIPAQNTVLAYSGAIGALQLSTQKFKRYYFPVLESFGTITSFDNDTVLVTWNNLANGPMGEVPKGTGANVDLGTIMMDQNINSIITYNESSRKFSFSNCDLVETSTTDTNSIFWGLDPAVSKPGGTGFQAFSAPRSSDFTLEQSGWARGDELPLPDFGRGLHLSYLSATLSYLTTPSEPSTLNFVNFRTWDAGSPEFASDITVTEGGRISFAKRGVYMVRVGLVGDLFTSVAYGGSSSDGLPAIPEIKYTHDFRVITNPALPVVMYIIVADISIKYYFYVSSSNPTTLGIGSFFSFTYSDFVCDWEAPIPLSYMNSLLPLSNARQSGIGVTIHPWDSSFTFNSPGAFLMTAVISVRSTEAVSSLDIRVGSSSNVEVFYSHRLGVGYSPSIPISIPFIVKNADLKYYANIVTTASTFITSPSWVMWNRVASTPTIENSLPLDGLLTTNLGYIRFQTPIFGSFFDFSVGGSQSHAISINCNLDNQTAVFKFNERGVYMFTIYLITNKPISAISIGGSTSRHEIRTHSTALYSDPYQVAEYSTPYQVSLPIHVLDTSIEYTLQIETETFGEFVNTGPDGAGSFISISQVTSELPAFAKVLNYKDSVGTHIIESAELKIGGQIIETLTGEYIEMWNDLNISYENRPALKLLTGRQDSSPVYTPGRTYYVNLPFYFFDNPELSIPLVSLGRQDVEVYIKFKDFGSLQSNVYVPSPTLGATIITEYVYLSDSEIAWFQGARIDHVITQCQYQSFDLLPRFEEAIFQLEFKNPIRELFFIVHPVANEPYDYSGNGVQSLELSFNGEEVFTKDTADALVLGTIEPYKHHINTPTREVYMYSFAADPTSPRPSGQVNFSRISQALLTLRTSPGLAKQLRVIGVSHNILRFENGLAGLAFNT